MMAESFNSDRDDVLKLYSESRTCIKSNAKELLQRTHAHLANKEGDGRFPALGVDMYHLLWKLINQFENPDPDTILKIQAGFAHLEQYALNLWKFPWRKEFHVIKTYTGFFKCKVECSFPDIRNAVELIKCLGYKFDVESKDHFLLEEPLDTEKIQQVSFDLFLVTVDLQIIHEIADFAETRGYSLKQAIKARHKAVGGKDEAISWLQRQPKDESMNKKLKLDKDSGTREEPESIGRSRNKPPEYKRSERTMNGQGRSEMELNQEASQSHHMSSDRETKYPPRYPSSSVVHTRDHPSAQYAHSSALARSHAQTSVSGSNVNLGAVEHRESEVEQLTEDQLYGHSPENDSPASEGVERMEFSSSSNGLTTGDQQSTGFSRQLPLSSNEEKLYVNLPDKMPTFTTNTTEVGRPKDAPEAPPTLSPGSPPPAYIEALLFNDYVMVARPYVREVDPVVTENMHSAGLTDERTEGKTESYQGHYKYNPQLYDSKGSRESDLSSINASMSKTLNLGASSTSEAAVCSSRSENGDRDIETRAALHRPGSSLTGPQTGRSKSAPSSREFSISRETPVSDEASTPVVEDRRRYQSGRFSSQGTRDRKRGEGLAALQSSTGETLTSDRYSLVAGGVKTSLNTPRVTHCDYCSLDAPADFICTTCYKIVCEACEEIFNEDLCEKTNLPHRFLDMRSKSKKSSSLKTWNCLRCTLVNPGELNVCVMCSTTRGLSTPELPEPGSPVCRRCTYCNKEGSTMCAMCKRSLRLDTVETSV